MKHKAPSVAVVVNRKTLSKQLAGELRGALDDAGYAVEWMETRKGSAASDAARRAVKSGATHVIACGGDGTVRAASEALVGTDVTLGVVPTGAANLFAGALGLPTDITDIVALVAEGNETRFDMGRCNDQVFGIMAGTGLDATMIADADDSKEGLGRIAYLRSGVRAARRRELFGVTVQVDGSELFEGQASCVVAANIGTVMVGSGKKIRVKLTGKQRYELDGGEKGSSKRLFIECLPGSLVVRVPAKAG